jgi:hypothetical protein
MNFNQQNVFYCRSCNLLVPISLPSPIREGIERSLLGSVPMGRIDPPLLVACPSCAVVYSCTLSDLRLLSLEMPDLRLDQLNIRLIRARRGCGTRNCAFLAEIHTIAPNGTKLEELRRTAATWSFRALVCPECHAFLRESLVGEYEFEGFDSPKN